jgi:hypothetical protein
MSKLILSASLLLILEISIAQVANDWDKVIIAPYSFCLKGLNSKDTSIKEQPITVQEVLFAGGFECTYPGFEIASFHIGADFSEGNTGIYREVRCLGSSFNEKSISSIIKNLKVGSLLFIDQIFIKNKNGKLFGLRPRVYKIVDSK